MKILSESVIKDVSTNHQTYIRGLQYYINRQVEILSHDAREQYCNAQVTGTRVYNVIIRQYDSKQNMRASCNCPAYQEYSGYCKHISATLIYLLRTEASSQATATTTTNKKDLERVLNLFHSASFQEATPVQLKEPVKELLKVKYDIKLSASPDAENDLILCIKIHIGTKRMYLIKQPDSFLNNYHYGKTHFVSDKFTYDPVSHSTHEEDHEIFRFLLQISDHENFYYQLTGRYHDERFIVVPPIYVESVLQLLNGRNYLIRFDDEKYDDFSLYKDTCPIRFSLTEGEGRFHLNSDTINEISTRYRAVHRPFSIDAKRGYYFDAGAIYKLNTVQREMILPLHQEIQHSPNHTLSITKDHIDSFASIVFPKLKKNADFQISEAIKDKIVEYPLRAELFLDVQNAEEEDRFTLSLLYHYGDHSFNPLGTAPKKDSSTILIREHDKETQIMQIIEDAECKYNGQELYLDNEESIFHFILESLAHLEPLVEIQTTPSAKKMLESSFHSPVPSIEFDQTSGWLEFRFEAPTIEKEELTQIIQALIQKKKYYRLQEGGFVSLQTDTTDQMLSILNEEKDKKSLLNDGKVLLPTYRALQIDDSVADINRGQLFKRLIKNMKDPENLDFPTPPSLKPLLRDYQNFGYQWMRTLHHYGLGGILADDMGLGKTIQALAFLLSQSQEKKKSKNSTTALIITPASLIYNWEKECSQFTPELSSTVVAGTKNERAQILDNFTKGEKTDILITSYPLIRRDIELYRDLFFDILILDEAQSFKNNQSQTFQCIQSLNAITKFALSGTPMENSIHELWSIFQIILPGLLPGKTVFNKMSTAKIVKRTRPFILRRLKTEVLTELPDKIETIQISGLTEEQKKIYLATLTQIQTDTKRALEETSFQKARMQILAGLTRLRQICCHPSLYLKEYSDESGKMNQFFELLEELLHSKRRVLVFSQFTSMLDLLEEECNKRNIPFHFIRGNTPSKDRLQRVDKFNAGENNVFFISLKAGGTGLNLTGADTVILYDLWWNPAVEQQATDRAHRMGQKKSVQVFKLISKGTIEEKILALQKKKQALFESVVQSGGEDQVLTSMNEQDIRELLNLNN